MKISLIAPRWTETCGAIGLVMKRVSRVPPLNLAYLAAIAEQHGHEVQLVDAETEDLSLNRVIARVRAFSPDIAGLSASTPIFNTALDCARRIKKEIGCTTVIGGSHVTAVRQEALADGLDYLVVGDCDVTFPLFLRSVLEGRRPSAVPGLIFKDGGRIICTGDAPVISDLSNMPFPARHLLRNDLYVAGTPRGRRIATGLVLERGCPFKCIYCAPSAIIKRRPIENVIAEIKECIEKYSVGYFYIYDDILTVDRKYALSFSREIRRQNLDFMWEASTRANLLDEELAVELAGAGLTRLTIGLESADDAVRNFAKNDAGNTLSIEEYDKAFRLCRRHGIETLCSVMIGLPGDTRVTIRRTMNYVRGHRDITCATCSIAVPLPGTAMRRMAERNERGLRLVDNDYSHYQRYGTAVMVVGDILPDELVAMQKTMLSGMNLMPWRIFPFIRRFGFIPLAGACIRMAWGMAPKRNPEAGHSRAKPLSC